MANKIIQQVGKIAKEVIEFAEDLGFTASLTASKHIRFSCPGKQTVFFSSTPSCPRAHKNCMAKLRRAHRGDV